MPRSARRSSNLLEWPDLGAFYDGLEALPIPGCVDNMAAFVGLWPERYVLTTNELYGHGQLVGFSTVEIKKAIWQLVLEQRLQPVKPSANPRQFYVSHHEAAAPASPAI